MAAEESAPRHNYLYARIIEHHTPARRGVGVGDSTLHNRIACVGGTGGCDRDHYDETIWLWARADHVNSGRRGMLVLSELS